MEKWRGKVALVTGASEGIGAATVKALLSHGLIVIGCARQVEKVEALEGEGKGTLVAVQCDVSQEQNLLKLFERIKKEFGTLHVLVNNAGSALNAPLMTGETEKWRVMLDVNVLALSICTREAIKLMQETGISDGHIIHINSMAGHRVIANPATSFYSATKFAVTGLAMGLRNELREEGIGTRVTSISPGIVETRFMYNFSTEEKIQKLHSSMKCLQAEDIAEAVVFALSAPPHVDVNEIYMRPSAQVF